jgi:predicted phosphoribosyltransferase
MHAPHPTPPLFDGSEDAGARLSEALDHERSADTVVIALAPHGAPVGAEVAERLALELDVVAVQAVVAASHPRCVLGAVVPEGPPVLRVGPAVEVGDLVAAVGDAARHAEALDRRLHRSVPRLEVAGRPCIVVDEALTAPEPILAVVRWLRGRHPRSVAVAVPAGSRQAVELVRAEADELVCLHEVASFWPRGAWYRRAVEPPEAEVMAILERARGIPADVVVSR